MSIERVDSAEKLGKAVFYPSHLTKALLAAGIALGAGGVSIMAGGYALYELRRVRVEEVRAMIKGG